jgi:hypothetical protein
VPSQWDLVSDKQMMQEEQPLQVKLLGTPFPSCTLIGCPVRIGVIHDIAFLVNSSCSSHHTQYTWVVVSYLSTYYSAGCKVYQDYKSGCR